MEPQENNNKEMPLTEKKQQEIPLQVAAPPPPNFGEVRMAPQGYPGQTAQQVYQMQPPYSYPAYQPSPRTLKIRENAAAEVKAGKTVTMLLLTFVFGFLVSELFLHGGFGLSVAVLGFLFCFVAFWYVRKKEIKPSRGSAPLMIFNLFLFSSYFFINSTAVWVVNAFLLALFIPIWLVALSGRGDGRLFSFGTYFSALGDQLEGTFTFLAKPLTVLSSKKGIGLKSKTLLYAIMGLLASLPVVAVFIGLYSAADPVFEKFIEKTMATLNINVGWLIADIIIGAVICLFMSAWLFSTKIWESREKKERSESKGALPAALVASFMFLIVTVSAAFVAIQFQYFFSKRMPVDVPISSYAKRGFYELVVAAGFITLLVGLSLLLTKRQENGQIHGAVKIVLTLLTVSGGVLLFSAVNKMILYIQMYDTTILRILVLWLIAVLALIFIGLFLRIWFKKVRLVRFAAVSLIVIAVLFNISNPDWMVARVNVDRYLNASSESRTIDTDYLERLTVSAVPELVRLQESIPEKDYKDLINAHKRKINYVNEKWRSVTLADFIASSYIR